MLLIWLVILFASLVTVNNNLLPRVIMGDDLKHDVSTQLKLATTTKYQLHGNVSLRDTSLTKAKLALNQTPWWQPLILPLLKLLPQPIMQFVVSGLVAGFGLFFANISLDIHKRPKLSVDKKNSHKVVQIDLAVYKIDEKLIPYNLRQFTVPYNVNRILVRNKGRSAAKNSKGVLKVDDMEYRVCWSVPTERRVATINSNSMEYMDLSAGLIGTQNKHFQEFCERVTRLQDYIGRIGELPLRHILELEV